jgi:hypothetical protein
MRPDTAKRLARQALRLSDYLNKMVRDIEAHEPGEDSLRLRQAIGRVMWAVYYEILSPTFEEHPSVEHELGPDAVRPVAHRSTRPPERRRSPRRRLR